MSGREQGSEADRMVERKPLNRYWTTIVADPPWPYPEGFADAGNNHLDRNGRHPPKKSRKVTIKPLPYPSMSLQQIAGIPIRDLAAKDCRIFLWATSRHLYNALSILQVNWGFLYVQTITWDKRPNVNPLTGSVAPNAAEFLLVGRRGSPPRTGRWDSSIVSARKPRSEHSRKPDVFLDLVETVSPGPYLELFARRNRLGWDTWGNEALEHVAEARILRATTAAFIGGALEAPTAQAPFRDSPPTNQETP